MSFNPLDPTATVFYHREYSASLRLSTLVSIPTNGELVSILLLSCTAHSSTRSRHVKIFRLVINPNPGISTRSQFSSGYASVVITTLAAKEAKHLVRSCSTPMCTYNVY